MRRRVVAGRGRPPVRGALAISLSLRQAGLARDLVLPEANADEAALVAGVAVFGAAHLLDLVAALSPGSDATPLQLSRPAIVSLAPDAAPDLHDIKGKAGRSGRWRSPPPAR